MMTLQSTLHEILAIFGMAALADEMTMPGSPRCLDKAALPVGA